MISRTPVLRCQAGQVQASQCQAGQVQWRVAVRLQRAALEILGPGGGGGGGEGKWTGLSCMMDDGAASPPWPGLDPK